MQAVDDGDAVALWRGRRAHLLQPGPRHARGGAHRRGRWRRQQAVLGRAERGGHRRVDLRAVVALAAPLFVNTGIQAVLNLTDTWFLGRISTDALAGVESV